MFPASGRLSPSAIDRYRTCPRQFKLRDIEGVPEYDTNSEALAVGKAVHEALSYFHRLALQNRSDTTIGDCLRAAWPRHTRGVFPSVELERAVGERWLAHLAAYADTAEATIQPVGFERWAEAILDGVRLGGRLDRIDRLDDGRLRVVDYKTGRCRLDDDDLPRDSAAMVYALAAQATYGTPTGVVSYVYVAEGTELRWELEEFDIDEILNRLRGHLKRIHDDNAFDPVPGDGCRFCPVRDHCPDADRLELGSLAVPKDSVF